MKILEYEILGSPVSSELIKEVNMRITIGWQPYGAPYVSSKDDWHYQAMVKYERYNRKVGPY